MNLNRHIDVIQRIFAADDDIVTVTKQQHTFSDEPPRTTSHTPVDTIFTPTTTKGIPHKFVHYHLYDIGP